MYKLVEYKNTAVIEMNTFRDTDFFFYLTTEKQSSFFPIRFEGHHAFMLLLNFWGVPDIWGDNMRYGRMGQDKFNRLTNEFIENLETIVNKIKRDPNERHSKADVCEFFNAIKQVEIDKFFAITRFCIPDFAFNPKDRLQLCMQVTYLNCGKTIDEANQVFESKYQPLFDVYDIEFFGASKQTIGKTSNRTCRFCGGKESEGALFGDEAHAIPKAVGNDLIFCNEECNSCNHEFGEKIERDFVNYFIINRALYKVKNRSKNVYIGENFCIDRDNNIYVSEISDEEKRAGVKLLNCKEVITNNSLYRSLAKFVVNVIDEKKLASFDDTIKWIKGSLIPASLPEVMVATCEDVIEHSYLQIFTRKVSTSIDYPYCFALLHCIDLAFLFIIPLSDQGKFHEKDILKRVLHLVSPLLPGTTDGWYLDDLSTTDPKYVWKYVDVNKLTVVDDLQAKKDELHRPTIDVKKKEYADFPPFSQNNIVCVSHKVLNFKEYCSQLCVPKEEYLNSNLTSEHSLYVKMDGTFQIQSCFECETNKQRKMFNYEQIETYRLQDYSASINIEDESFAIDIHMVRDLLRRSLIAAHDQLNDVYHQYLQLLPIKDSVIDYTITHLNVFIERTSGQFEKTPGEKLWNIKFMHI